MGVISRGDFNGVVISDGVSGGEDYVCPDCMTEEEALSALRDQSEGGDAPICFLEDDFIKDHYIVCDRCGKQIFVV